MTPYVAFRDFCLESRGGASKVCILSAPSLAAYSVIYRVATGSKRISNWKWLHPVILSIKAPIFYKPYGQLSRSP